MHACASSVFDRNADHQRGASDAPEEQWSNAAQRPAIRYEDRTEMKMAASNLTGYRRRWARVEEERTGGAAWGGGT